MHGAINPRIEIDDLADTGLLTTEQRDRLGEFRTFEKGVRALTGNGMLSLHTNQKVDSIVATFRDPQTGENYSREEGLDIAPLIRSAREDVELARNDSGRQHFPQLTETYDRKLREAEERLRVLEENSVAYTEAFPNALDESNPVERARIAEEARRVWKNPLTRTGSIEGDKRVAVERLRSARLLKVPGKEEPKAATLTPVRPTPTPETPLPTPIRPTPPVAPSEGSDAAKPWEPRSYFDTSLRRTDPEEAAYRRLVSSIRESGMGTRPSDIADRIRTFRDDSLSRLRAKDPLRAAKVDRLLNIKMPAVNRNRLFVLLLPLLLFLNNDSSPRSAANINEAQNAKSPQAATLNIPTMPEAYNQIVQESPLVGPVAEAAAAPLPPSAETTTETPFGAGDRPERHPTDEVVIQSGQELRNDILLDIISKAVPEKNPIDQDRIASVATWITQLDNPHVNVDDLRQGDRLRIRKDLPDFARSFNPANPAVDKVLNSARDNPEERNKAMETATKLYDDALRGRGI